MMHTTVNLPPLSALELARNDEDLCIYRFIMFRNDRVCIGGESITKGFNLPDRGTKIGDVEYTARVFEVQCYGIYNLSTNVHKLIPAFGEVTDYVRWIWQIVVDRTELMKRRASPEEFQELERRLMLGGPRILSPAKAH